jgi:hypothetical protein
MVRVWLRYSNPNHGAEKVFSLSKGTNVTIGRSPQNNIVVLSKSVSRKHITLRFDNESKKVHVINLSESNPIRYMHSDEQTEWVRLAPTETVHLSFWDQFLLLPPNFARHDIVDPTSCFAFQIQSDEEG